MYDWNKIKYAVLNVKLEQSILANSATKSFPYILKSPANLQMISSEHPATLWIHDIHISRYLLAILPQNALYYFIWDTTYAESLHTHIARSEYNREIANSPRYN